MNVVESDVCVIGAGICGVLLSQRLKAAKPGLRIVLVDAGRAIFDVADRMRYRRRYLDYDESAWPGDYVDDQLVVNGESQTMAVGGWALHWEGGCPRFSEEDIRLKSLYGFGEDWPLSWDELEKAYCDAERAIGVAGEPSPYPEDRRSAPYPMPGMPLSFTLEKVKTWAEASGLQTTVEPTARNTVPYAGRPTCTRCDTCAPICPTGAKYSPDFTARAMVAARDVELYPNVLIRRLELGTPGKRVVAATGVLHDRTAAPVEFRARIFALALGKYWTPHLLLLSACPPFPNGLANSSGLVGKFMSGTSTMSARIQINEQLFYGMHTFNALVARKYFRCPQNQVYIRHDTRFSTRLNRPRLLNNQGGLEIGDALLNRWRAEEKNVVDVTIRFAFHAARDSGIVLDGGRRNPWGDPLPQYNEILDEGTAARQYFLARHFVQLCQDLVRAGGGTIQRISAATRGSQWRSGGCRMSNDPSGGVCDSVGRSYDHENLFIAGAPTLPNPGIGGETLAYVALSLRSADAIAKSL